MDTEEKAFVGPFIGVLGILGAFTVIFLIIANVIVSASSPSGLTNEQVAMINQRTQPIGEVNTSAQAAKQAMQAIAKNSQGGSSGKPMSGKQVYQNVCSGCHAAGMLGSPKFGSTDQWKPHAAKGLSTLYDHAIHGFKKMPAKGGNASLTDKDVQNGVRFMLKDAKLLDVAKKNSK